MSVGQTLAVLRRAFVDILRGYSTGFYKGRLVYIKHLAHFDHVSLDDLQLRYEEEARTKRAPFEKERLEALRAAGKWSDKDEADIERQRDTIIRFEEGKRSHSAPSIIEQYDRQIADERQKLIDMALRRAELIGMTAELYAQRVLNDHYVIANLFIDKGLTKPLFDTESFDDLSDSEVDEVMDIYTVATEPCSDANLRKLAVQDFFTSYYSLCSDNLQSFYGRPICELTYYQVRLGNIARYFKHLLEHTDLMKVPPNVKGDPDAIERLHIAQKNAAVMHAEGKLPSNLTNQDIKTLGLEGQYTKLPKTEMSGAELVKHLRSQHRGG